MAGLPPEKKRNAHIKSAINYDPDIHKSQRVTGKRFNYGKTWPAWRLWYPAPPPLDIVPEGKRIVDACTALHCC